MPYRPDDVGVPLDRIFRRNHSELDLGFRAGGFQDRNRLKTMGTVLTIRTPIRLMLTPIRLMLN